MKLDQIKNNLLHTGVAIALVAGMASTLPTAYAGGKITIDDTKWISIGMGIRGNFSAVQNQSANGSDYSNNFSINNARIYINGQVHKYIKFTFNTECFNCGVGGGAAGFGTNSNIGLLDAIAKFEFNRYVNLWAGRTLANTERGELNGPYYHATFEGFKTPFFPQDYSGNNGGNQFGTGAGGTGLNSGAGLYGRDDGVVFFGDLEVPQPMGMNNGTLQYSAGVFSGLKSTTGVGPNQSDSASYTGRLTYNFLNPEKNPGYYTSGTYYGTAGDILAIAVGVNHQKDGAGSFTNRSDFTGVVADVLFEKPLDNNMGVLTFNGEYKRFWANYNGALAAAAPDCFCVFRGQSWTLYGLYLIPHKVGIGRFQPYGRFTSVQPEQSTKREEIEGGVNYVIDGHNARISAFYQHGDLFTKGLNYNPGALGQKVDKFTVAFQLQI
jgi:hypothetical protein